METIKINNSDEIIDLGSCDCIYDAAARHNYPKYIKAIPRYNKRAKYYKICGISDDYFEYFAVSKKQISEEIKEKLIVDLSGINKTTNKYQEINNKLAIIFTNIDPFLIQLADWRHLIQQDRNPPYGWEGPEKYNYAEAKAALREIGEYYTTNTPNIIPHED